MTASNDCNAPAELSALGARLPHLADALRKSGDVTIVAIGSSSTKGEGASSDAATYPNRLNAALSVRFPGRTIRVLNRGVGGEEAGDEVKRFAKDVLAENPVLVIWQVGTNAAWKNYDLAEVQASILEGLDLLAKEPADVVLMNLQYAPALLDQNEQPTPATAQMLGIIAKVATDRGLGLFRRFEIMRYWRIGDGVPFEQMISGADGNMLHQNDWSYNCVASALCDGIVMAVAPGSNPSG